MSQRGVQIRRGGDKRHVRRALAYRMHAVGDAIGNGDTIAP